MFVAGRNLVGLSVLVVLVDDPFKWEYGHLFTKAFLVVLDSLPYILKAERGCKVNSLSNVEAVRETSMIDFREGAHIRFFLLSDFIHLNSCLLQVDRVYK